MAFSNRWKVLEGNRRLAAIRILQKPQLAKGTGIAVPEISKENLKTLKEVTIYAVANPDQARDFIGFKHINGPHKWDAIAKARFDGHQIMLRSNLEDADGGPAKATSLQPSQSPADDPKRRASIRPPIHCNR